MLHVYMLAYQGPLQGETAMVYVLLTAGTAVLNLALVGQDALDLSLYCDISILYSLDRCFLFLSFSTASLSLFFNCASGI